MVAVRRWNEDGGDTQWSYVTWGRMTHTYWNCFRCHWCWMSLPLQANKKETLIQNTPLRGHTWHKTQMLQERDTELPTKSGRRRPATSSYQAGGIAPDLTPGDLVLEPRAPALWHQPLRLRPKN